METINLDSLEVGNYVICLSYGIGKIIDISEDEDHLKYGKLYTIENNEGTIGIRNVHIRSFYKTLDGARKSLIIRELKK
jgi:hypothetical protein